MVAVEISVVLWRTFVGSTLFATLDWGTTRKNYRDTIVAIQFNSIQFNSIQFYFHHNIPF